MEYIEDYTYIKNMFTVIYESIIYYTEKCIYNINQNKLFKNWKLKIRTLQNMK